MRALHFFLFWLLTSSFAHASLPHQQYDRDGWRLVSTGRGIISASQAARGVAAAEAGIVRQAASRDCVLVNSDKAKDARLPSKFEVHLATEEIYPNATCGSAVKSRSIWCSNTADTTVACNIKMKSLSQLAKQIWGSELCARKFEEKNGRYLRVLNSGVVHHLALAKDPHGGMTFMLMCGLDVTCRDVAENRYGFIKYRNFCHLTRKGWDSSSARWPCETEEEAQESLTDLRQLVLDLALPWLDAHTTLSSVGDEICEIGSPGMGWMKARLYLLDGDIPRARETIERYTAYAALPRPWISRGHRDEEIERAERMRHEIDAAAKGRSE